MTTKPPIEVRCPFKSCYKCCLDTQMLLTLEDIQRIESKGYKKENFCFSNEKTEGFWQLKNIDGKCYFLSNGKCSIYEYRPMGCRTYPLVFDLTDNDVIIDNDCREPKWFADLNYEKEQIELVKNIAKTLLDEQKT